MNQFVQRCADWYCRVFGSPIAFVLSLLAVAAWLALIPFLGFAAWNTGPGLLGNTVESTGEWFFGVGTLLVAGGVAAKQHEHSEALDAAQAARDAADRQRDAVLERLEAIIRHHGIDLADDSPKPTS